MCRLRKFFSLFFKIPPRVFIKEPIFENLKDIFGKDVEILVNY